MIYMKKNTYLSFESYKNSRKYEEADLSWLKRRLSPFEIEELKKQINYLILEAEEEAFMSACEGISNVIELGA